MLTPCEGIVKFCHTLLAHIILSVGLSWQYFSKKASYNLVKILCETLFFWSKWYSDYFDFLRELWELAYGEIGHSSSAPYSFYFLVCIQTPPPCHSFMKTKNRINLHEHMNRNQFILFFFFKFKFFLNLPFGNLPKKINDTFFFD